MTLATPQIIVLKYGGNAMTNTDLRKKLIQKLGGLNANPEFKIILVHGGGPFIKKALSEADIHSEFFEGHRITSPKAMKVVEKVLKGEVNANLVSDFLAEHIRAVGISGKDGNIVQAMPREATDNNGNQVDLGRVGDVKSIDSELIYLLLEHQFLPVIACLGTDEKGDTFNINADMMAGALAGALKAHYFILTDVDGLYKDINDPESKIDQLQLKELSQHESIFDKGMIPKMESCKIALESGAQSAKLLNGTKPDLIEFAILHPEKNIGTKILK